MNFLVQLIGVTHENFIIGLLMFKAVLCVHITMIKSIFNDYRYQWQRASYEAIETNIYVYRVEMNQ